MAWLVVAAYWFWDQHSRWFEMGKWLMQLLPHRQAFGSDLRLTILVLFYSFAYTLEDPSSVDPYREEMRELAELTSYKLLQASAWHFLARFSVDISEAEMAWERAIA